MRTKKKRNSRLDLNRWSVVQVSRDISVCTSAALSIWKNRTSNSTNRCTAQIVSQVVVSQLPAQKENKWIISHCDFWGSVPGKCVRHRPSVWVKIVWQIHRWKTEWNLISNCGQRSTGLGLVPEYLFGIGRDNLSSFCYLLLLLLATINEVKRRWLVEYHLCLIDIHEYPGRHVPHEKWYLKLHFVLKTRRKTFRRIVNIPIAWLIMPSARWQCFEFAFARNVFQSKN